jgi:hypothetical protein
MDSHSQSKSNTVSDLEFIESVLDYLTQQIMMQIKNNYTTRLNFTVKFPHYVTYNQFSILWSYVMRGYKNINYDDLFKDKFNNANFEKRTISQIITSPFYNKNIMNYLNMYTLQFEVTIIFPVDFEYKNIDKFITL